MRSQQQLLLYPEADSVQIWYAITCQAGDGLLTAGGPIAKPAQTWPEFREVWLLGH